MGRPAPIAAYGTTALVAQANGRDSRSQTSPVSHRGAQLVTAALGRGSQGGRRARHGYHHGSGAATVGVDPSRDTRARGVRRGGDRTPRGARPGRRSLQRAAEPEPSADAEGQERVNGGVCSPSWRGARAGEGGGAATPRDPLTNFERGSRQVGPRGPAMSIAEQLRRTAAFIEASERAVAHERTCTRCQHGGLGLRGDRALCARGRQLLKRWRVTQRDIARGDRARR
jgi:hypothetical protein